jgi:Plasmid pRiA4b ORF-3-like protein
MTQQAQSPVFYQLRLVLTGISPMIWRRLLISSETSIAQLHEYIQICFDWDNEHLHCFAIAAKSIGSCGSLARRRPRLPWTLNALGAGRFCRA